jgi:sec-independent protein translocase protein TatA
MFLKETWHWVLLVLVFAVLFGGKRLPDAARHLGRSMRVFKSEMKQMKNDDDPKSEGSSEK